MLLFSVNPYLKYVVQHEYANDVHFVWCSAYFDSATAPSLSLAARTGATSDPIKIYSVLRDAVRSGDHHEPNCARVRAGIASRARLWHADGKISKTALTDISEYVKRSKTDMTLMRPLIYVIPTAGIDPSRVAEVSAPKRAGLGREFQIADLRGSEFRVIEGL